MFSYRFVNFAAHSSAIGRVNAARQRPVRGDRGPEGSQRKPGVDRWPMAQPNSMDTNSPLPGVQSTEGRLSADCVEKLGHEYLDTPLAQL